MREIKFKAWDKTNKKWCDCSPAVGWVLNTDTHEIRIQFYGCTDGNIDLIQYTGLKDKNGKEIYEGDIVKGYLMINDDDYSFTDVISYKAPSFICDNSADFGLDMYELEVIGNIYENPELLEATND